MTATEEHTRSHDAHQRAADIIDALNAYDFAGGWEQLNESGQMDYADLEDELASLGYQR